jgi:hypothetical protein
MKKSKKAFKSSLFSGHKGKVVIQKNNLSLRKALASNVVTARAALKGRTRRSRPTRMTPSPPVTIVSSVYTNGTQSTSGMSSLTQESTRYKKHGGKDIIQADAWIRKHRSHRGHSELMDNRFEQ